jgi:solute carrier family 25 folate transporter 32
MTKTDILAPSMH